MIEIIIALISSATTIFALFLRRKNESKKFRDSFSDIANNPQVEEFTIHIKNKKGFRFETNACELVTKNDKLKIAIGYSNDVSDDLVKSNSSQVNLIHQKLERLFYG